MPQRHHRFVSAKRHSWAVSRALELLLLAGRPCPSSAIARGKRLERAAGLLEGGVDESALVELAVAHGVGPLLSDLLRAVDVADELTRGLLDALKPSRTRAALTHLVAPRVAVEVCDWLAQAHVESLVLKGPTLSDLYPGGLREFCDVDVLIDPTNVETARRALLDRGYVQIVGPPHELLSRWMRLGSELCFGGRGQVSIDLHWRLADPGYPLVLPALWSSSRYVDVGAGQVLTLGREELVLYLCHHGSKHLWERLLWLCDLARVLEAGVVDWSRLEMLARQTGTRRILALALALVRDVLDCELPPLAQRLTSDIPDGSLAEVVSHLDGHPWSAWQRAGLMVRLRERHRHKLLHLLDLALRPSEHEWRALPLPPPLFPLYSALRVGRLLRKYTRRR